MPLRRAVLLLAVQLARLAGLAGLSDFTDLMHLLIPGYGDLTTLSLLFGFLSIFSLLLDRGYTN